jgi:hypothetical protein
MFKLLLCFFLTVLLIVINPVAYISTNTSAVAYVPIVIAEYQPPEPTNGTPRSETPGAGTRYPN